MTPRQQSVLIGAVVTGILSTSYFSFINVLCCIGVVIGGMVASQQYVSRTGGGAIQAGDGAVLGALAGVGGMILGAIFDRVLRPFNLDSQSITEGMQKQFMQNMGGEQGMSPEMMQQFQGDGSGMLSLMGILFFGIGLVIYAIFGAIGGALGTAIFGEEEGPGHAQPGQAEWSE